MEKDRQNLVPKYSNTCKEFSRTISIRKTEVMGQNITNPPVIIIEDDEGSRGGISVHIAGINYFPITCLSTMSWTTILARLLELFLGRVSKYGPTSKSDLGTQDHQHLGMAADEDWKHQCNAQAPTSKVAWPHLPSATWLYPSGNFVQWTGIKSDLSTSL